MHLRSRFTKHALASMAMVWMLLVCGAPGFGQVNLAAWPQVRLQLFAFDSRGNPLPRLTAGDLELKENGRRQTLSAVSQTSAPESVCVVIDASGSMHDRLSEVKAAAARLMQGLPAGTEMCLADFSVEAFIDAPLTTDRAAAIDTLKFVKASGGTALYDAVIAVSRFMRKSAKFDRRSIVLLTDGDDNYSKENESAMLDELHLKGSPVVSAMRIPSSRANNSTYIVLEDVSAGGGLTCFPRDQDEMIAAVDNFNAALKARYEVQYQSDQPSADGRKRRIALSLVNPHQKERATLRAPEGYYAPSQ